ncbi:GIY-YIG nuclease family protein [Anaerobacillus sp. MEB173]|uniref:GIY-YIG nuclease family protein n=1 Tax=Anaerobacillus sp. MEB173 TaxID=3383345 RepID=UPI003F8F8B1C
MMNLKEKVKKLPASPGVYLMKDSYGHVIYVGKAKNLKNRVRSYFQTSNHHSKKVEKLVGHVKDFDYRLTDTEFEAFMLECKLIKQLQPMYNRLMKSPQSYTYILIERDKDFHRIELVNHINKNDKNLYFGPYTGKNNAGNAIKGLKEFLKMDCSQPSAKNIPCLNYSLGLCMGKCFDHSALQQYQFNINRIIALLKGNDTSILEEMKQKMMEASLNCDFEKAAKIRDSLEAVNQLLKKEKVIEFTKENKYIVMMEAIDNLNVKLFIINRNKVIFNEINEIEDTNINEQSATIKSTILAHYKAYLPYLRYEVSKDEIDEAQIIYRYVKSNACKYFFIPETLLCTENEEKIDLEIANLFKVWYNKFLHLSSHID